MDMMGRRIVMGSVLLGIALKVTLLPDLSWWLIMLLVWLPIAVVLSVLSVYFGALGIEAILHKFFDALRRRYKR